MTQASDPLTLHDRLLAATYRCVERFGMGKTTIDDIVKESGVSRATIYRQFAGGRDELLLETVGLGARQLLQPARRPRARRPQPGRAAPAGARLRAPFGRRARRAAQDHGHRAGAPAAAADDRVGQDAAVHRRLPVAVPAPGGRGRPAAAGRRHRPGRRVPGPLDPVAHRCARPLGPRRPRTRSRTWSRSSSSAASPPRPENRPLLAIASRNVTRDTLTMRRSVVQCLK